MKNTLDRLTSSVFALFASTTILVAGNANAQLTDVTQTTPSVPGGAIGKSLQQQIGTGRGDVNTPGSSIYLIKRDPARSIRRGRELFQRKFTAEQGVGPRVNENSSGNIKAIPTLDPAPAHRCAARPVLTTD